MRIYAILEDIGSEYYTLAPVKISLTPFNEDCSFIDIEEGQVCKTTLYEGDESSDWKPYNGIHRTLTWYNFETKEFSLDETIWDENANFQQGEKCQKYENGIPVGEPYFEEL